MSLEKRKERTIALFDKRHWDLFTEFTKYEMASGGPDPHVAFVGAFAKDCSFEEKLWRGGCYISAYNVATAEVIWRDWPWPKVMREPMLPWLYEHWSGMTTRTERKGVRIKENMDTYFQTYAAWMRDVLKGKKKYLDDPQYSPEERYELLWEDLIGNVKYVGRYVAIKLLEYFRRYCGFDINLTDVRPLDGWSPRTTLSLLFPKRINYFLGDDSDANMEVIDESADEALSILHERGLVQADHFTLEVALCNYRQSYIGLKLYPGRTHDTELRYKHKIEQHWKGYKRQPTLFFGIRQQIFPDQHLGEINDAWLNRFPDGVRSKDIGCLTKQGFVWSDLLYDYNATVQAGRAFDEPIERKNSTNLVKQAFVLRKRSMSC